MALPLREFNLSVLGASNVGKTCICERLVGKAFARKPSKPSMEDAATRYSLEVNTSAGLLLVHLFDWAWEVKRRDESINQQLMRGSDGAVFVYDVTDRRTIRDFLEHVDWYQRAAGFDKPYVIVSNKNDQKKRIVTDAEGLSLARSGDRRSYAAVSLVDDTGLDELVLGLCRVMMNDLNLSVTGYHAASEPCLAWSDEKLSARIASIGLSVSLEKSKRVLLLCLNKSIADKFVEAAADSEFIVESVGSAAECEEELAAGSSTPIVALAVPPSAPESQQSAIKTIASANSIVSVVVIPRGIVSALREAGL